MKEFIEENRLLQNTSYLTRKDYGAWINNETNYLESLKAYTP